MILALDVGVMTGACVLRQNYELAWSETLDELDVATVFEDHLVDNVVVELPLIVGRGELAQALRTISNTVEGNSPPNTWWVLPATWKQHPAARVKVPRGLTQHERDAIRIAVWYNNTHLQGGNIPPMIDYA